LSSDKVKASVHCSA